MTRSDLPQAKTNNIKFRIGGIVISSEVPTESRRDNQKVINQLQKAAQKKVFIDNASPNSAI